MNVELEIKAKTVKGRPEVHAFLSVTNNSQQHAKFEMFRIGMMPDLSPPTDNFFEVRLGKTEIAFVGTVKKRAKVPESEFVTLKPGQTIKGSFDISEAYAWRDPRARYTIWYDNVAPSAPIHFEFKY